MAVEERRRVDGKRIAAALLAEKADDDQVVAQDADAALGCLAARRKRLRRIVPFTNRGEEIEFDAGLYGGGTVERLEGVDHALGRRQRALIISHRCLLVVQTLGTRPA